MARAWAAQVAAVRVRAAQAAVQLGWVQVAVRGRAVSLGAAVVRAQVRVAQVAAAQLGWVQVRVQVWGVSLWAAVVRPPRVRAR